MRLVAGSLAHPLAGLVGKAIGRVGAQASRSWVVAIPAFVLFSAVPKVFEGGPLWALTTARLHLADKRRVTVNIGFLSSIVSVMMGGGDFRISLNGDIYTIGLRRDDGCYQAVSAFAVYLLDMMCNGEIISGKYFSAGKT